jgi:DNA-binding XRE family transcriptional regulator
MKAVAAKIYSHEDYRLELFNELQEQLDAFPVGSEDDALFQSLLTYAQNMLELEDTELAKMLQVSRPTINRWVTGRTAPHPLARRAVMDALSKVIGERKRFINASVRRRA